MNHSKPKVILIGEHHEAKYYIHHILKQNVPIISINESNYWHALRGYHKPTKFLILNHSFKKLPVGVKLKVIEMLKYSDCDVEFVDT